MPPLRIPLGRLALVLGVVGLMVCGGCRPARQDATFPRIATTTSYLEAVVQDLLGDAPILRLAEPGTCPGHFDMRPSQVAELRLCRVLLRFDFQKSLDAKFAGSESTNPAVAEVVVRGGMSRPDSYLAACRQTADHFVRFGLLSPANAATRLEAIAARIEGLAREATNRIAQAGLVGSPIVSISHQRDFCEWLGLKVVAAFRAADTASIGEIEQAIDVGQLAQVKRVIANLPEGRRTADALADRLKARVVVFENFPALRNGRVSFDEMLLANVDALLQPSVR